MIKAININSILESPWQGRMILFNNETESYTHEQLHYLAEDIKINGLLNPVIVRPMGQKFELIDGHRRVLAFKLLGIDKIDAVIKDYDDRQAQTFSIIGNLQRKDLSNIELGIAYQKILDSGIFKDKKELSNAIGKDETYIGDLLNTLNMDARIVEDLKKNKTINDVRMLRAIRRIEPIDENGMSDKQWELFNRVINEKLSRQDVLEITKNTSTILENETIVNYRGKNVQIELPFRLSKDQKKIFSKLVKEKVNEIFKLIQG